jgi:hypothetical protein
VLLYKTAEAGQVGGNTGDAHHCTLSYRNHRKNIKCLQTITVHSAIEIIAKTSNFTNHHCTLSYRNHHTNIQCLQMSASENTTNTHTKKISLKMSATKKDVYKCPLQKSTPPIPTYLQNDYK